MGLHPHLHRFGSPTAADLALVDEALAATGIEELADRPVTRLSGGEKQRVAVARALAQRPEVLLLDEPTASLDDVTERKLLDNLDRFCQGRTLVIATHRLSVLQRVERIIVLDGGRIVIDDKRDAALAKLQGAQA